MPEMTGDQAAALREKISQMSPEELKEFQKKQCIFCQIISGKVASKQVYSDDKCIAILDINPANPGHIVLLPKEHYSIMPLIPSEELSHLFMVAKALAQASLKALEAQGTNIFVANGAAAGQKAQHFMIHIIPRKEKDNVKIDIPEKKISGDDMKKVIERMKPAVGKALGLEVAEKEEKLEAEAEEKPEAEEKEEEKEEEIEEKEEAPMPAPEISEEDDEKALMDALMGGGPQEKIQEAEIVEEKKLEPEVPNSRSEASRKAAKKKKAPKKKAAKKKAKKKKKPRKKEEPEEETRPVTLDDISSLMTGGR